MGSLSPFPWVETNGARCPVRFMEQQCSVSPSSINFADDTEDHQRTERISPELVNGYRPEYAPVGVFYISLLISVRSSNVFCCHHWFFFWYLIPPDSPILQENLIECICQRFQCIFSFDWFQLAFPNGDRMPAHSGKFMLHFHITLLVPLYFVDPKLSIGFRVS